MKLIIEHVPLSKNRHRSAVRKGKCFIYDPQTTIMRKIKWVFAKQMRAKGYLKIAEGPIRFRATFHIPIPKSWSKKRRIEAEGQPVTVKPDWDNRGKIYGDILNGIAYSDDAQICSALCEKFYSATPRVEIIIKPYVKSECW